MKKFLLILTLVFASFISTELVEASTDENPTPITKDLPYIH